MILPRLLGLAGTLWLGVEVCHGQRLLTGSGSDGVVRLHPSDIAVMEAGEKRDDLPCTVDFGPKATLGFDLRFHTGYQVLIPLAELAGNENTLQIIFRVTQEGKEPTYFAQRVAVPKIVEEAKGQAILDGGFDLGEGKYKIEWLMRDRQERVCFTSWDVEAVLPPRDKEIELAVAPHSVLPVDPEQFREEPPVARPAEGGLRVKFLVNFAPQKIDAATFRPLDTGALVSILRSVSRDQRIGKISLTAFNMQEQRVLSRQKDADRIDFPAIGNALNTVKLGTVDVGKLKEKSPETQFLTDLIKEELAGDEKYDAIVFAGPKALLEENVPADALRDVGQVGCPVFYMNFNLAPQAVPWRDAIGHAVRFFRGQEFTITRPRDLWYAVTDMVGRIVQSKRGRQVLTAASAKEE